jgi:hypothetical protein
MLECLLRLSPHINPSLLLEGCLLDARTNTYFMK